MTEFKHSVPPKIAIKMKRLSTVALLLYCLVLELGCSDSRSLTPPPEFQLQAAFPAEINQSTPVKFQFGVATNSTTNPYDPDEVSVTLELTCPDGTKLSHPAFYRVDYEIVLDHGREVARETGSRHWEVRWTPMQVGEYQWSIEAKAKGKSRRIDGKMTSLASNRPGFVRVSPSDPQYFELSNGDFFYPLGHVIRSPSDTRWADDDPRKLQKHHLQMSQKTYAYERCFEEMAANHENFCSLWMAPWWLGIEWSPMYPGYEGAGRYNQIHAAQLDRILESAERHGIYVLLFVMNHGQISSVIDAEWDGNPYGKSNGGPVQNASDVFTNDTCERLYRNRLNYILARWGYSPALFGISLSTETDWIEPYDGCRGERVGHKWHGTANQTYEIPTDKPKVNEWLKRMSRYIHENDIHRHVVSVQFARIDSGHDLWNLPEFDFALNNCYENAYERLWEVAQLPEGGCAEALFVWNRYHDLRTKPKLIGEWGGNHLRNPRSKMEADLHIGIWALAMTDCSGAAGYWWWNEIEDSNLYRHFNALHEFLKGYDRRGKQLISTQGEVSMRLSSQSREGTSAHQFVPHPSRAALVLSNSSDLFAYVYHQVMNSGYVTASGFDDFQFESAGDTYLSIPDTVRAGRYAVELWDTFRGEVRHSHELTLAPAEPKSETRRLALTGFRSDVAVKLRRIGD